MSDLVRVETPPAMRLELAAHGLDPDTYVNFRHGREIVVWSVDRLSLEDAHRDAFGIRVWLHISVSVQGALAARLADQKRIGRQRHGGERSPAPLPDWYALTHLAYDHPDLGFDRTRGVWQYLPPPGASYLNVAEALHLRQPR
jgi:hypothetical protein